jgi:F-type H+-transporting ATPase subunit c
MKGLVRVLSGVSVALVAGLTSVAAFANEGAAAATSSNAGIGGLGAAIAISVAAFGGALAQGKTAAAALEGMARNPQAKLLTPMIIGLALIESLVIYALVIAFTKY